MQRLTDTTAATASRRSPLAEGAIIGRPRIPLLREKVLRSAASLFAEKGFDDVLVEEVAARAGVGKGSVYRQFSSKEELYTATVIEGYIELRARIAVELEKVSSVTEAVTSFASQIVSYFWNRVEFFELLRDPTKLPPAYRARYRRERQKLVRIASKVLLRGAKDGVIRDDLDPQLLVECLFGMMRGIQLHGRGGASISQKDVLRTVIGVFLNGCSVPLAV